MFPVYVRTGLFWEAAELHWLGRFLAAARLRNLAPLAVLDLPVGDLYGDHWSLTGRDSPGFDAALDSNYLPGRNLLLLSKVAIFCALNDVGRVAMAPLADNPFSDGTPEFFRAFETAAGAGLGVSLAIDLPFRGSDKASVIRRGRDLPLELTFSCIRPEDLDHCGDCTKCAERQHGFAAAGVADLTRYRRRKS